MRFLNTVLALVLLIITCVSCAPTTAYNLVSLNFPIGAFNNAGGIDKANCPKSDSCGVITFESGSYAPFYEGICTQIVGKVRSIYVAHCYCSIWSICLGFSHTDEYVGGMMMCEKPRPVNNFTGPTRYISCGGRNS